MDPVRFGLVGFGLFGKHHANAIQSTDGAQLAGIAVKSSASQAAAAAAYPNVPIYSDYQDLLATDSIDVVDIVVPNVLHFDVAQAALNHGKHIFLEKPMACSGDHCDQLQKLASDRQRIIAINHELRLSSLWGGVRELIVDGVIGQPQYCLIELSRFPYRMGSEGWRWDIQRVGNWILEEPIHFFDLARWYMSPCGEPVTIYARGNSRHPEQPQLCDNFSATVNFGDGGYAVVSQTLAAFEHHVSAKISGTKGTIWAHWSAADARSDKPTFGLRYGLGDDIHQVNFTKSTGELLELADQISALVHCIRTDTPPPCTGEDGSWSTKLCLAAQQSLDENRIIEL